MDAIQYLLHLHSCEQEGISSGMPTPQQWIDAVEAARKQYAEQYSVVAWECIHPSYEDSKLLTDRNFIAERCRELGYTVTELVKKLAQLEEQHEDTRIAEYENLYALFKKGYVYALPVGGKIYNNELREYFDKLCTETNFNFKKP